MGSGNMSQLLVPLLIVVVAVRVVWSRMRPQPVRPGRSFAYLALILVTSIAGLAANPRVLTTPLFLGLAPVALLAGLALGWWMVRLIRFWHDEATGELWMNGGVAYIAIWLVLFALRLGIEYADGGLSGGMATRVTHEPTMLTSLASALLFLSIGLWLARSYGLMQRVREDDTPQAGTWTAQGGAR
jgi:hypothetical protein